MRGHAGGWSWEGESRHGLLDSCWNYTTLDVVGVQFTQASGIKAVVQIVGYYGSSFASQHGFLLSGGVYTTFDVPGPLSFRWAAGW